MRIARYQDVDRRLGKLESVMRALDNDAIRRMSTEELEFRLIRIVERVSGRLVSKSDPCRVAARFLAKGGGGSETTLARVVGQHVERLSWFERHGNHGGYEIRHLDPPGRPEPPYGRALVLACRCSETDAGNIRGGLLATYLSLVPIEVRRMIADHDARPRDQVGRPAAIAVSG